MSHSVVNLEDEVHLRGEQASGTSHTSKNDGETAPSMDGSNHDEVSKYFAVDHVVFMKELTVRDSVSGETRVNLRVRET